MGTWGTGPLDSDAARDWLGDACEGVLHQHIRTALHGNRDAVGYCYEHTVARTAAHLVIKLHSIGLLWDVIGHRFEPDDPEDKNGNERVAQMALDAMRTLQADASWFVGWKSPEDEREVRAAVVAEIAELERIRRECEYKRRQIAKATASGRRRLRDVLLDRLHHKRTGKLWGR